MVWGKLSTNLLGVDELEDISLYEVLSKCGVHVSAKVITFDFFLMDRFYAWFFGLRYSWFFALLRLLRFRFSVAIFWSRLAELASEEDVRKSYWPT